MNRDDGIRAAIDRIGRLMHQRSPAFADEFAEDAVLVGSEPGEVSRGREAIRALIATFHALPARYTWEWETIDIRREGAIACDARLAHGGRTTQVWDAPVVDESTGKTIALFRCTQMILWPREG